MSMAAASTSPSNGHHGAAAAAPSSATSHREVAIFWDYENLSLPGWVHPADASKLIVEAVSARLKLHAGGDGGRIVDRRLYFDFYRDKSGGMFAALDSTGFDLVNTPSRNQKETLDKKLIADVLTFAWDSAVRNDNRKPCVVLLTSDGDYAYTLSKLRDRGIMSFVIHGNDTSVAKVLKSSADVLFNFETDILKKLDATTAPGTETNQAAPGTSPTSKSGTRPSFSPPSLITTTTNLSISLDSPDGDDGSVTLDSCLPTPSPSKPSPYLFVKNVTKSATIKELVSYLEEQAEGLVVVEAFTILPPLSSVGGYPPFMFAQVKMQSSTQAAKLCDVAKHKKRGMILGDRELSVYYNSRPTEYTGKPEHYYERKVEVISRSVPSVSQVSQTSGPTKTATTTTVATAKCSLFVKNIPSSVTLRQLVQHLENQDPGIKIVKASAKVSMSPKRRSTKNARVQFGSSRQASKLLELKKPLVVASSPLEIVLDKSSMPITRGSSAYIDYYESPSEDEKPSCNAASSPAATNEILLLCRVISRLAERTSAPNSWVYNAILGASLKKIPSLENKDYCQKVQTRACQQGLVEFGRRRLNASLQNIDVVSPNAPYNKEIHDMQTFFRLTPKGTAYLASNCATVGCEKTSPSRLPQSSGTNLLCRALRRCTRATKLPDSWCHGAPLRISLKQLSKEKYQALRTEANKRGFIETGRRQKESGKIVKVTGFDPNTFHPEAYYRLTPQGNEYAENPNSNTSDGGPTPRVLPDLLDNAVGDSPNIEAPPEEDDLLNLSEHVESVDEKETDFFADLIDLSTELPDPLQGDRKKNDDPNQSPVPKPTNGSDLSRRQEGDVEGGQGPDANSPFSDRFNPRDHFEGQGENDSTNQLVVNDCG